MAPLSSNFVTRTALTVAMIAVFVGSILKGHLYVIGIVAIAQVTSFMEVMSLVHTANKEKGVRNTKSLSYYFLGITMYFLYGKSLIYYFKNILRSSTVATPLALDYHRFMSLALYAMGFVFFIWTLQEGSYREQFAHFAWTHLALIFLVIPGYFATNTILDGLFWFLLPTCQVVTNDIFAYLCGKAFGRTQLIKLSPKKTLEGFLGAWFFTVLFTFAFVRFLSTSVYLICPVNDLGASFATGLSCDVNPALIPQPLTFDITPTVSKTIVVEPMQIHGFFLATLASLVAPWGGFFASAIKRTLSIKDFGDSIPGHGGVTDRVDCQFVMVTIAYMYYHAFVLTSHVTPGELITAAITRLNAEDQLLVVKGISESLIRHGISRDAIAGIINGS
jgi:phosphatidate cytidylyltransferase